MPRQPGELQHSDAEGAVYSIGDVSAMVGRLDVIQAVTDLLGIWASMGRG